MADADGGSGLAKREDDDALSAAGKIEQKGLGWLTFKASGGLYAGTALSAFVLVVVMVWLQPFGNPQHFVLGLAASFVAGIFVASGVGSGRLKDALRRGDEFRAELHRVTEAKAELERTLYPDRQSSIPTTTTRAGKRK